ncbi:MAG: hypothetical protein ACE5JM_13750 [Armatimonadota bacterium]
MRTKLLCMTVALLLLPCLVMADGLCGTPGVSVMYGERGDDGEGFGASLRYLVPAGCGQLMLSGSVSDGESVTVITNSGQASARAPAIIREDTTIWAAAADFVRTVDRDDKGNELFYGGGVGWYKVDGPGWEEDSLGGQVLGGITFSSNWFAEVRYVFATEFDWGGGVTSDVDGVRFSIGRWFK